MIRTNVDIDFSSRDTIVTDHLIFRHPTLSDAPQMMELTTDPALLANAITRIDLSINAMRAMISRLPSPPAPSGTFFLMYLRKQPGEFFGVASYAMLPGDTTPRISLWIRERYRRHRAFACVVPGLLDFAFQSQRLGSIQADAFPEQRMTPTLAIKYGFTFIGYRREFCAGQNRIMMMSVMELRRTEWLGGIRDRFIKRSSMIHALPLRLENQAL